MEPPAGTIALLFTDIEGSTALASRLGPAWAEVLAVHHALVGGAIAAQGGFVDRTDGDAFFATFADAAAGARAAVAALRALRAHAWPPEAGELRVRMGLHVGFVERAATGYVGLEVHRAARVAAAAHGGQLLITAAAKALVEGVVACEPVGAHRLKDFPSPEALFCAVVDGRGADAFPPPRAHGVRPTNLPAGALPLVGRERDLERVRAALLEGAERLVTLTGRGGVGKTSVALRAAGDLLDEHPGGVWLVRLAAVSSAGEVPPAIASAIGADREAGPTPHEAIAARLRDRGPVLLVLDNLEHVASAAADVAAVLDTLPDVRVLATSQAPLRLPAERRVPVDALADEAALALIERVARRRGGALPDGPEERAALLDVVHLLDGLPLALELAAARLAVLSPAQLRDRLRASSELLHDAGPGRLERHQSLRATVDWTLGLLADAPRSLFDRMGAFAGPVELHELEAVAGRDGLDVLDALAALLDFALARRVETGDGRIRFDLPEALRRIAAERLDVSDDGATWRRAHAERQRDIAWAARWLCQAPGADYRAALAAQAEAAVALRWTRATGHPLAAPLGAAFAGMLADNGRMAEAFAVMEPLLAAPSGEPVVDAHARLMHAYMLLCAERTDEALAAVERARALSGDAATQSWALLIQGLAHTWSGDYPAGARELAQAAELARDLEPAFYAGILAIEAQPHLFAGDAEAALRRFAAAERIGAPVDAVGLWYADAFHGDLALKDGRPREALARYVRSLEIGQAAGNQGQVLTDLLSAAHALAALGADAAALEAAGMAAALNADVLGPHADLLTLPWLDALPAAEARAGAAAAAEHRARGRAVPQGLRVARIAELARAPAAAPLASVARA